MYKLEILTFCPKPKYLCPELTEPTIIYQNKANIMPPQQKLQAKVGFDTNDPALVFSLLVKSLV